MKRRLCLAHGMMLLSSHACPSTYLRTADANTRHDQWRRPIATASGNGHGHGACASRGKKKSPFLLACLNSFPPPSSRFSRATTTALLCVFFSLHRRIPLALRSAFRQRWASSKRSRDRCPNSSRNSAWARRLASQSPPCWSSPLRSMSCSRSSSRTPTSPRSSSTGSRLSAAPSPMAWTLPASSTKAAKR